MCHSWLRSEEELFTEKHLEEIKPLIGLEQSVIEELRGAASLLREQDTLWKFLLECQLKMYGLQLDPSEFQEVFRELPSIVQEKRELLKETLGEKEGLYAVMLVVVLLDWTLAYYRSKGIPDDVLVHTMEDLGIWMNHYETANAARGLDNLSWLLYHVGGRLFRIGRLQFVLEKFQHRIKVIQSASSKENNEEYENGENRLIVLSEAGVEYRSDGLVNGTNGMKQVEGSWVADLKMTDTAIIGHPIHADGKASSEELEASFSRYQIVLESNDLVLDVHIPEGSRMSPDACTASMEQAIADRKSVV